MFAHGQAMLPSTDNTWLDNTFTCPPMATMLMGRSKQGKGEGDLEGFRAVGVRLPGLLQQGLALPRDVVHFPVGRRHVQLRHGAQPAGQLAV